MSTGDHPRVFLYPKTSNVAEKPRVGLNAHLLSLNESYRSAGVSRYIHYLLAYLPQVDTRLSCVAFLGAPLGYPGWREHVSPWRTENPVMRILWEQIVQPLGAWGERLDLLHVPVYVGPIVAPCPVVVTVHDLSFYHYPEMFPPFRRAYLQTLTRRTVRHAAHVIVDSASTRSDVVHILDVPESKVTVIPLGVDARLHPIEDRQLVQSFRERRGLPERMILYLGTLEPRKNLITLLEAYALLRRERALDWIGGHRLVIAGGKGWYYQEITARVEQLKLQDEVLFPGYIPQEELALWINAADLFVYPSVYEGFGLPPLEAMACGTPVVVSDAAALREVVGEAGIVVEAHDPQALARAIADVLHDRDRHRTLREAGLARARQFSWEAMALQTAGLYHRILGDRQAHG